MIRRGKGHAVAHAYHEDGAGLPELRDVTARSCSIPLDWVVAAISVRRKRRRNRGELPAAMDRTYAIGRSSGRR
jgi:hypothetical protein